ncbi:MAG TPA: FG-GAP-like repeat-containing protein, partial [Prosthecobacter sp.]|nr:FG-GAP-like repeat-containing protein [Prosthecobacter sp.]
MYLHRFYKTLVAAGMVAISLTGWAADTTTPSLGASHTWIQKEGSLLRFNLLLDPQDDQGIQRLEVREKINATTIPANAPWREAVQNGIGSSEVPWKPEQPLTLEFNCTSMVLQVRAVDTSGNYSEVITRTYKSPFPLSPAPDLAPAFGGTPLNFSGPVLDCRGVFTADFDGNGRDDLLVLDRTTGLVKVRRQTFDGTFTSSGFNVAAGTITDGAVADVNADGKPDIVVVAENTVKVYENQGLDQSQILQFQESTPGGLPTSGMSVVQHVVAADLTGEGKPELIISGTGDGNLGGNGANVAVLLNNEQFSLAAANNAIAPAGSSAGRMAVADFDADGDIDVAMLDESQKQIVVFQNRGNSSFAPADSPDEAERPWVLKTGISGAGAASADPSIALAPRSLAVGDISGDGRPDLVVTMHGYFGQGSPGNVVYHNMELWQLFENRGAGSFQRWPQQLVSQSGEAASEETFVSDVILEDLNKDRLPELVFASHFDSGIRAIQFMPWLNRQNQIYDFTTSFVATGAAANPQRLTAARFGANSKKDIVVANGATNQLSWWFTMSNIDSTKALDLVGGASTSSDPNGTAGINGALSYTAYTGDVINYSVTCINNTTNDLTGVTLECPLPKEVYFESADAGYTSHYTAGVVTLRWTLDIPAGTSAVRSFAVEVNSSAKAKSTISTKMVLKQGTKSLFSSTLPAVKILAPDLHVFPTSFGQSWSFAFKPLFNPPAGAMMWVQGSFDGTSWFYLNANSMTRVGPFALEWNLSTTSVPAGCRYFRTAIVTHVVDTGYSSVFNTFLPMTTGLKVSSKSPPKSGNTWAFTATQPSTAANLSVRFQSTESPYDEGSWTDLPMYSATTRAGNVWTFNTYNVPAGQRYFRAIAAAPGWVDSISNTMVGPVPVQASPPGLPPFTHWHIDGVQPAQGLNGEYAHQGDVITFSATTASVPGIRVRFQSKLHSDPNESAWTDLEGVMKVAGTKWTLTAKYLPVGFRDFRAISSAPGYLDNTTLLYKGVEYSTVFAFLIKEPRLPQIPTIFGSFEDPANGSLHRTGISVPVSIKLYDFNGVHRAFVQQATPGGPFKEIPNTNMTNVADTIDWTTALTFSGTGQIVLRVAVVDQFTKAETCYSNEVTITVG